MCPLELLVHVDVALPDIYFVNNLIEERYNVFRVVVRVRVGVRVWVRVGVRVRVGVKVRVRVGGQAGQGHSFRCELGISYCSPSLAHFLRK